VVNPAASSRLVDAATSSAVPTSTPRWFNVPGVPPPSMSTSFSGGSEMAKLAYPGRRFAGPVWKSLL